MVKVKIIHGVISRGDKDYLPGDILDVTEEKALAYGSQVEVVTEEVTTSETTSEETGKKKGKNSTESSESTVTEEKA